MIAGRRTRGIHYAWRYEYHRAAGCARRAVDQADLQRSDESGRRAHPAASRGSVALSADGELFEALIAEGEAVAKAIGIELHGDPRSWSRRAQTLPANTMPACCRMCSRRASPKWTS